MSIVGPIRPQPDEHDLTLYEAQLRAQRDFAWLAREHEIRWEIDIFTGRVRYLCTCDNQPRNKDEVDAHLSEVVQKQRGAVRPPKKR